MKKCGCVLLKSLTIFQSILMIVQSKSRASDTPTQSRTISIKSKSIKQSKTNEFYYQEGEGVREFSSDADTPLWELSSVGVSGCCYQKGSPLDIESIFRVGERCLHTDAP